MNRIHIGIAGGSSDGWRMLLEQEGVPHSTATDAAESEMWSVLVASGEMTGAALEMCKGYVSRGGGLLCDGQVFARLFNEKCARRRVRFFPGDRTGPMEGLGFIDVDASLDVAPGAGALTGDDGRPSALLAHRGEGFVVSLPFDAGETVLDSRQATRSFYAAGRTRLPFERVSAVSKSGIRRIVSKALEILHHERGIPYAHLWYYTGGARSVFTWRVDTDGSGRSQLEALSALTRELGVASTYFVDVASQRGWLQHFSTLKGSETGLHCFRHIRYRGYEDSLPDIRNGRQAMEQAGINPVGFASPFGTWNEGVARAIQECGFAYSSEFAYDYDNLPSFPVLGGRRFSTLALPVHPISLGSLRRQGFGPGAMREYFKRVIEDRIFYGEPVMLYHHPGDDNEDVVRWILDFLRQSGVPNYTMGEFSSWWRKRCAALVGAEFTLTGSLMEARLGRQSDSLSVRVSVPGGKEAIVPAASRIDLATMPWTVRKAGTHAVPEDISRTRGFNPWVPLIRLEDALRRKG